IVSDISMPLVDGYDFIRSLRKPGSAFAETPAIALTAFARDEDRERALGAGYQCHVTKPVDALKLIEAARSLTKPRA
ncbi:MAG: response regulator, partial [Vicinamibacterales bacterium]